MKHSKVFIIRFRLINGYPMRFMKKHFVVKFNRRGNDFDFDYWSLITGNITRTRSLSFNDAILYCLRNWKYLEFK